MIKNGRIRSIILLTIILFSFYSSLSDAYFFNPNLVNNANITSNRYYYKTVREKDRYIGKKVFSTDEIMSRDKFNSAVNDFLDYSGACNAVGEFVDTALLSTKFARENWYSFFNMKYPGYAKFYSYCKVTYRVDRLTEKKYVEGVRYYLVADQYVKKYPQDGYYDPEKKTLSYKLK